MIVSLDGEGLESSLIRWTGAGGPIVSVPTLSLSDGQPTHELGRVVLSSSLWPEYEGPVVWHQAEGKPANGSTFQCLDENSFEGRIVFVVPEDLLSANGSIQHREDITTCANSFSSRHRCKPRRSGDLFLINTGRRPHSTGRPAFTGRSCHPVKKKTPDRFGAFMTEV